MLTTFRMLFSAILLMLLWGTAVLGFALYIDLYRLEDEATADGIIVLTGGGGRIEYGLQLLAERRGKALFISGVNKNVPMGDLINKVPMGVREAIGVLSIGAVTLGHEATNTIGNAQEGVDWVKRRGYQSIMLVTADYHLPRALLEFQAKLPSNVVLIPVPVKTHDYSDLHWITDPNTRDLIIVEFHKLVAAHFRHWIVESNKAS